ARGRPPQPGAAARARAAGRGRGRRLRLGRRRARRAQRADSDARARAERGARGRQPAARTARRARLRRLCRGGRLLPARPRGPHRQPRAARHPARQKHAAPAAFGSARLRRKPGCAPAEPGDAGGRGAARSRALRGRDHPSDGKRRAGGGGCGLCRPRACGARGSVHRLHGRSLRRRRPRGRARGGHELRRAHGGRSPGGARAVSVRRRRSPAPQRRGPGRRGRGRDDPRPRARRPAACRRAPRAPRRSGAPRPHGRRRARARPPRCGGARHASVIAPFVAGLIGWAGWPLGPVQEGTAVTGRQVRVHFVGIGGIGMSGIAEVLLTLGYRVSGSDLVESETTRRLARLGARIHVGPHCAANVGDDTDVLVISSAVTFSNPEVVSARERKIPVIPRAEMLAELMRMKRGVAVAGSHGKTTTTSLIAAILAEAGMDPTVVVGGKVRALGTNARLGQGEVLVAEADESDGTFLLLSPVVAVVTNIDREHLDYYGDMQRVHAAYLEFLHRVPFYGRAVLCIDNVNVRALLPQARKRCVTYGTAPDADWQARALCVEELETVFEVWRGGERLGPVRLRMPGRHHALNALAALAVAD